MSFLRYIDEDFLKIQEFLAVLTDTLPKIEPHHIKDESSLIRALIEQSKAYGKKIINLYESLDSYYKNSAEPSERGHPQSPQFTSRLHQKIQDYEDLIKKLTTENEEFNQQIKHLSKQIEGLHSSIPSQNPSRDRPGVNMTPSPINKKSSKSGQRDFSFELDTMFLNSEYNRALETLAALDYKKPPSISLEKFSNWLATANRIRDSQLSEIQNKLKILITFSDKQEEGEENNLDDSLDGGQHRSVFDKIYNLLDDKIPKLILQNEYRLEAEKQTQDEYPVSDKKKWATASFKPQNVLNGDGTDELNYEQLKLKVKYLNNNLRELEKDSREKDIEIDVLKDRLKSARESHTLGSPDRLVRENETLFETLENEMKTRFEAEARCNELEQINEELKEKLTSILRDFEAAENRIQELEANMKENTDVVSKLVQENNTLREQYEFSEKHEDMEKMRDIINEKEQRIRALQEELSIAKEYKVTPREPKRFISDTPSTNRGGQVETQLTSQANILMGMKRIAAELKSSLVENLGYLGLPSPVETHHNTEEDEYSTENTSEAYRVAKNNSGAIRDLNNDFFFIRQASKTLIAFSVDPKRKTLVSDHQALLTKITTAEEKLVENLANSLHIHSQIINYVTDNQSSGITPIEITRVISMLQNLHDYLNKTIQEFPEFTHETSERRDRSLEGSKTVTFQFKEKLIKDQSELTNKLKSTLQSLEKKQNDEALNQLSQEIDKNSELQKKIEAKSLVIHRMNMIYNEGIERSISSIDQLIKLADSQDAQRLLSFVLNEFAQIKLRFKDIIGSSKDGKADYQKELINLEHEYNKQRESWQKMLQETNESADQEIKKFIREIEAEREAHQRTTASLHEHQKRAKILDELKREVGILNSTIGESEKRVADLNRTIEEKQAQLLEKEEEGRVMHQKLRKVESNVDELTKEVQRYKEKLSLTHDDKQELADELHSLRDKLAQSTRANEDLGHEIHRLKDKLNSNSRESEDMRLNFERLKKENHNLVQELNDVVLNRGKDVETLQKQLEAARHELSELKSYKERTESTIKRNTEQIEQLRSSYYSEVSNLKESTHMLSGESKKLNVEVEKKNQELSRLNNMFDQLQSFSNKQLETLKQREDKINELQNIKRENENTISDLERKVRELVDKNHRQNESLSQNMLDINTLKGEVQRLIDKHSDIQRDLIEMKRRNEDLNVQNQNLTIQNQRHVSTEQTLLSEKNSLEDRLHKATESTNSLKTEIGTFKHELKGIKEEYESKIRDLENKEREILSLKDILKKERELARESELSSHLKKENKLKQEEIDILRKESQKHIDRIEQLNIEIDTLKATVKIQEQHLKEVEKVNALSQNLSIENETLRKSLKFKEEQYTMEREAYEREIQLLKKKINDMKSVLDGKEAALKDVPKGLSDSQRSGNSNQLNSSYLNSVIESKDLEIKRLSHIVKNLTENLKDTQEAKFKLKK